MRRFAEVLNLQKKLYPPGYLFFRQGELARAGYIVNTGTVELYVRRGDTDPKLVRSVTAGDCFGELSIIEEARHVLTAVAGTEVSAFELPAEQLADLLGVVGGLAREIVADMASRYTALRAEVRLTDEPPLDLDPVAQILVLEAKAKSRSIPEQKLAKPAPPGDGFARLIYHLTVDLIARVLSCDALRVKAALRMMRDLNLLSIQAADEQMLIRFRPEELVPNTSRIASTLSVALAQKVREEMRLVDLETLAQETGVDKTMVLKKLALHQLPESLFLIRHAEARRLLEAHGKAGIEKRRLKRLEDLTTLEDIEFVDTDTLSKALGALDHHKVALLLKAASGDIKTRILGCFSTRIRGIIEATAATMGSVDDVELQGVEESLLQTIRQAGERKKRAG